MGDIMEDGIMTLDQGRIGKSYTVAALLLPPRMERRLESLGMTEGTSIDVLNNKNCGRLIIKVRGTRLALGRGISSRIQVRGDD
jgi:ferrous iron transport protein A